MKKYIVLLPVLLFALNAGAQDIHFSQFYENNIMRNPALTGIFSGDYKVGVNYRTQWSNISVPFQTVLASAETRVAVNREVGDYFSFGVTATYDKAGSISFNSLQVYPAINYNKAIEGRRNSYLSVGFAGGYIQRSIDFSKATFSSQYVNGAYNSENVSGENFNNVQIQNYDVAAGVSINSSLGPGNIVNYYIAAGAYHITKPKHTFQNQDYLIRLQTKYVGNAGFNWNMNEQVALTTHFNYSLQGSYREIMAGGFLSWKTKSENSTNLKLYMGAFVRVNDAIIPSFKLDYSSYSFTFSYDVNTSTLKPATAGSGGFEISLFAKGFYKKTRENAGTLRCPRFEHMMPSEIGGSSSGY